jgi:hypothetical protein
MSELLRVSAVYSCDYYSLACIICLLLSQNEALFMRYV